MNEYEINEINILPEEIGEIFKTRYLDYALSVITDRALPNAIDGFKPVQRRIIYSMFENGLLSGRRVKCAKIVGDVMGNYHPHGDSSIYGTLVGMGQPFNNIVPFIDKQGNFGSIDGDPPASMRYTEAKLSEICNHLVKDIEYTDKIDNFDQNKKEPVVLPVEFPSILLNGNMGIAVGMASNILPHNLNEICDATIHYIHNKDCTIKDLCKHLKGPDFPTGGMLSKQDNIYDIYQDGKGSFSVRSHIELSKRGNNQCLIIKDLPWGVNKIKLVENIDYLSRDNKTKDKKGNTIIEKAKIEGIKDVVDESNLKNGIKICIILDKNAQPDLVVNQLYKYTNCHAKFNLNTKALVNGKPKQLSLKDIFEIFLEFRREIITRKLNAEKEKIEAKLHILDGYFLIFDKIKTVIDIIEKYDGNDLSEELQNKFSLSKIQADSVLALKLKRLSKLDRLDIKNEYNNLIERKKTIIEILSDILNIDNIIVSELKEIKKKYGVDRKTEITTPFTEIEALDTIPEDNMVIALTLQGYIKRLSLDTYKTQARKGAGVTGGNYNDDDYIQTIKIANTHDDLLFFTTKGKCYYLQVYMIPEMQRTARGTLISRIINLQENEKVTSMLSLNELSDDKSLILTTKNGITKRIDTDNIKKIRKSGTCLISIDEGDELIGINIVDDTDELLISSSNGMFLRISCKKIRIMGKGARGVNTIKLANDDKVVCTNVVNPGDEIIIVTEFGLGKRIMVEEYRLSQGYRGKGVLSCKINKTGKIVGVKSIDSEKIEKSQIMLMTNKSKVIRIDLKDVRFIETRTGKGVRLQKLNDDEKIASFDIISDIIEKQ